MTPGRSQVWNRIQCGCSLFCRRASTHCHTTGESVLLLADDSGIGHVRQTLRGGRVVYSDGTLSAAGLAA